MEREPEAIRLLDELVEAAEHVGIEGEIGRVEDFDAAIAEASDFLIAASLTPENVVAVLDAARSALSPKSEDFDLDAAVDTARREPGPCSDCGGTGRRQMHIRGPVLWVGCPDCAGTGARPSNPEGER